ncbi:hypothetical protein BKP45_13805 [Anaerobacillus alkalidiazotrophicus]|uniref:Uncharacterized protein n=1 Tax=Anaerobacillus alkalidiazotrophicus TaxID=472963 RepID=A0A1S2M3A2_9BACI|nr:hypothetical protein [Anaerobacillus alkalidiazotrophicus]OIJ19229.1 hypothetical protein BKP45_13805 [Anaerobacillus alkalidiazotrophicus]
MEQNSLTYFEKLEKLYILTETRQILRDKVAELSVSNENFDNINVDLTKIEEEIMSYTNGHPLENLDFSNTSLLNPAIISLYEEPE